jgi:delta 1-pyrroline-5-carboxylate dehydrogenase
MTLLDEDFVRGTGGIHPVVEPATGETLGGVGTAMTLADEVRSGKVHINEQTVADEPTAPFGGVGDSGNGSRFGGAQAPSALAAG